MHDCRGVPHADAARPALHHSSGRPSSLIALLPLLLFGPEALFGLTAAIFLGIFVGTYSSVYMAAPILIWLGVDSHSFVPEETELDRQEKAARDLG